MRFFSGTALALLATATLSTPATAGGLGIDLLGGLHTEKVYFFDDNSTKFTEIQPAPNMGFGIQAILGDRDDTLIGIMKFGYMQDAPASSDVTIPGDDSGFVGDSASQITARLDCEDDNAASVCGPRHIGTVSAGLQWRVWGDPMGFQVSLLPAVGAGIVTQDSSEFLQVSLGPGAHYAISKALQVHGEFVYQARYRKSLTHGATGTIGVRWLFD